MKALILAGGRGKRLNGDASSSNKCMTVVNGKPAIEYSLDCAAQTGVDEIVLVVGYKAEEIINTYGNRHRNKVLRYVIQWEQKGLVHAIECARAALEEHDFMLLLGDEILVNPRHQAMLEEFHKAQDFTLCGILLVEDSRLIRRTYSVIQDSNSRIYRLIEKPENPLNNIMGTGDCVFKNEIFSYIDRTPIHPNRQEKELPDLIQCAIDDGKIVRSFALCDRYANINSEEDLMVARTFFASPR
jgi:UDP-N-acetylglucosamine diphosphorylase / glucose-1-phosphate thymidylyltransferase / UDP-N-acetylgalactosamine diphosphorylase / glucosamine-1-phosphate N-acetyltransferase / galactosamine-1-phosphate N-acetyltransferase